MRIFLLIIVLLGLGRQSFSQSPFPINFTSDSLKKKDVDKKIGKIVAIEGKISSISQAYHDKPYFMIDFLGGGMIGMGFIWNDEHKTTVVGDTVKILGYFDRIEDGDSVVKSINKAEFHILGFCMVNLTKGGFMAHPDAKTLVEEWRDGFIPTDTN